MATSLLDIVKELSTKYFVYILLIYFETNIICFIFFDIFETFGTVWGTVVVKNEVKGLLKCIWSSNNKGPACELDDHYEYSE